MVYATSTTSLPQLRANYHQTEVPIREIWDKIPKRTEEGSNPKYSFFFSFASVVYFEREYVDWCATSQPFTRPSVQDSPSSLGAFFYLNWIWLTGAKARFSTLVGR
jgi:hypothetical protein